MKGFIMMNVDYWRTQCVQKSDFENAAEAQKFLNENQWCRAKFSYGYELGALDPAESK